MGRTIHNCTLFFAGLLEKARARQHLPREVLSDEIDHETRLIFKISIVSQAGSSKLLTVVLRMDFHNFFNQKLGVGNGVHFGLDPILEGLSHLEPQVTIFN